MTETSASLADRTDFDNAQRGLIDAGDPVGTGPIQTPNPRTTAEADLTLTLTKGQLLGGSGLSGIDLEGDTSLLGRLTSYLGSVDPVFPIVTP